MKILHTSDWHLGHTLFGRKRQDEFRAFLAWLGDLMDRERVEALLLAGDVFDSGLPGNQAQALYYRFLHDAARRGGPCRHVVVVAGNHDSPTFLDAPGALLRPLGVHVTGRALPPEEEVLALKDGSGRTELIVCAVPFLRDRDLYRAESGDSPEDRERRLNEGLRGHYLRCAARAEALRAESGDVPVIALGHLFAAGGLTVRDDGVRELHVGSLGRVDAEIFPAAFDYVALGHLHIPQRVHGEERIRYSGSPLPMGFDEADRQKSVFILETEGRHVQARAVAVPTFQRLEKVCGELPELEEKLTELSRSGESVWAEVIHTGTAPSGSLRERVLQCASGGLEVLRIRNARTLYGGMDATPEEEALEDMDVEEVFERRLREAFPDAGQDDARLNGLRESYREIIRSLGRNSEDDEPCAS